LLQEEVWEVTEVLRKNLPESKETLIWSRGEGGEDSVGGDRGWGKKKSRSRKGKGKSDHPLLRGLRSPAPARVTKKKEEISTTTKTGKGGGRGHDSS